jgi:hypothetical protein
MVAFLLHPFTYVFISILIMHALLYLKLESYGADSIAQVQCHCETCQKISGGAFTVNVMVHKKDVKITQGKSNLRTFTKKHVLGNDLTIYFCDTCSSNVWKNLHAGPTEDLYVIQTGTLNGVDGKLGADVEPPTEEGFPDCRAAWLPKVSNLSVM